METTDLLKIKWPAINAAELSLNGRKRMTLWKNIGRIIQIVAWRSGWRIYNHKRSNAYDKRPWYPYERISVIKVLDILPYEIRLTWRFPRFDSSIQAWLFSELAYGFSTFQTLLIPFMNKWVLWGDYHTLLTVLETILHLDEAGKAGKTPNFLLSSDRKGERGKGLLAICWSVSAKTL